MKLTVELGGGLEILFGLEAGASFEVELAEGDKGEKSVGDAAADSSAAPTVRDLVEYLAKERVKERPELFVVDGTVRPGILVLINEADWELCGGIDGELEEGDAVVFISTLHGG